MTYSLGIDLGTTYSAAAVHRDGSTRIVELGSRSAAVPSVVFLRDDETVLAGETAQRRASSEPQRVAREFKRRIGDTTPVLLGGAAYSAEALTARLLGWIVDQVVDREGGRPDSIAITHPANWGPYKIDLLHQAIRLAGLDDVELLSEPEAAARHYASQERVEHGSVIAVYDLGGGTFDAAVLLKADNGFELLGRPEGIERLGGIDFDAAVLAHVVRALDGVVEALDTDDPGTLQALARLRTDCVDAKEGLSGDTEVSIPVVLPNVQTEVRLTRAEFEAMTRPTLADTLAAMRRALTSAGVEADDVAAVLLVGGSSRIPLVAQLVSNEFGRPVAVDADPKHAIALGAALAAADRTITTSATAAAGLAGHEGADRANGARPDEPEPVGAPTTDTPMTDTVTIDASTTTVTDVGTAEASPTSEPAAKRASRLPIVVGAALAGVAALAAGAFIVVGSGGGSSADADAADRVDPSPSVVETTASDPLTTIPATTSEPAPATTATTSAEATDTDTSTTDAPTTAAPTPATPSSTAPVAVPVTTTPCPIGPERTVCIDTVGTDDSGGIVAGYTTTGYTPELEPIDFHIHFYFDTAVAGDENNAGSAGSGGDWRLWDAPNPFVATGGDQGRPGYTAADARAVAASQLCAVVADHHHAAVVGTGNCIDLPDEVTGP